jgi:FkbM family methyltransferase
MTVSILNFIHRLGLRRLLAVICQVMYFLKGYGYVPARYHSEFRAYEFKVRGIVFLSLGPGWAFSTEYLTNALRETYCFQYMPKEGDCIVDIGSGLGEEVVIYALLAGKTGSVHAMEANPRTYIGLKYMSDKNQFGQVSVHHLAIYNCDGEVTIDDDENNYLGNTINSGKSEHTVKATTMDTFVKVNKIRQIDFLKSNIEGSEQYLIEGMRESISIIRNFCISCHDFRHVHHNHGEFYMTKEKVRLFLEANGFSVTTRNTGNRVIDDYIYAVNNR